MSLGLVAYDTSDESGDSDVESNKPVIKSTASHESKDNTDKHVTLESELPISDDEDEYIPVQDDKTDVQQKQSEPPISDDEDEFIPTSVNSGGSGGLLLPPPKHGESAKVEQQEAEQQPVLLLNLPKPKAATKNFVDEEEEELEDFVKTKDQILTVVQEKPPSANPKSKKRKIVQITVPAMPVDSDEEDEVKSNKVELTAKPKRKCGLFDVLPAPKNVAGSKEHGKKFIPETITKVLESPKLDMKPSKSTLMPISNSDNKKESTTKRSEPRTVKSNMFIPASLTRKSKQSSISAFNLETGMMMPNKSKKKQSTENKTCSEKNDSEDVVKLKSVSDEVRISSTSLVSGVPMDEDSDDDDDEGGDSSSNFFAIGQESTNTSNPLGDTTSGTTNATQSAAKSGVDGNSHSTEGVAAAAANNEPLTFSEPAGPDMQDAPLQFKKTAQPYGHGQHAGPSYAYGSGVQQQWGSTAYTNQQYNMAYVEDNDGDEDEDSASKEVEDSSMSAEQEHSGNFMEDEEFLKMQGKSKRGKEEINFIDVHQKDQISDVNLQVKNLSEETSMMSYSKKKNKDMPSSQQKKKHQITYLAFKAKETELELKNQWANNRSSKKQTQAKYGF